MLDLDVQLIERDAPDIVGIICDRNVIDLGFVPLKVIVPGLVETDLRPLYAIVIGYDIDIGVAAGPQLILYLDANPQIGSAQARRILVSLDRERIGEYHIDILTDAFQVDTAKIDRLA